MDDPAKVGKTLMERALTGKFLFRDQDILNKVFRDAHVQLDARWNVFNSDEGQFNRVPKVLWDKAKAARADPWIIHFADRSGKPWTGQAVPYAEIYWKALMRTPFWTTVAVGRRAQVVTQKTRVLALGRALALRYPATKRPLMWIYNLWRGSR